MDSNVAMPTLVSNESVAVNVNTSLAVVSVQSDTHRNRFFVQSVYTALEQVQTQKMKTTHQ